VKGITGAHGSPLGSDALAVSRRRYGWAALTGSAARILGISTFGASGPGRQVCAHA